MGRVDLPDSARASVPALAGTSFSGPAFEGAVRTWAAALRAHLIESGFFEEALVALVRRKAEADHEHTPEQSPLEGEAGITASTTQSQGEQPLTAHVNHVETCANADDVVTLPSDLQLCVVRNSGANQLQVYPASGWEIDDNGTDASVTIGAGAGASFWKVGAASWVSVGI